MPTKTQKELDDDIKFRNKFRDGPNDKPRKKKKKLKTAGDFLRTKAGTNKPGAGALAKRRKKAIDDALKRL